MYMCLLLPFFFSTFQAINLLTDYYFQRLVNHPFLLLVSPSSFSLQSHSGLMAERQRDVAAEKRNTAAVVATAIHYDRNNKKRFFLEEAKKICCKDFVFHCSFLFCASFSFPFLGIDFDAEWGAVIFRWIRCSFRSSASFLALCQHCSSMTALSAGGTQSWTD